jgi:hypothetical protein
MRSYPFAGERGHERNCYSPVARSHSWAGRHIAGWCVRERDCYADRRNGDVEPFRRYRGDADAQRRVGELADRGHAAGHDLPGPHARADSRAQSCADSCADSPANACPDVASRRLHRRRQVQGRFRRRGRYGTI